MITVEIEKECGCFKKSDFTAIQTFSSKELARQEAQILCEEMNETFCQKHNFMIDKSDNQITIKMALDD
ncbi:MAG: hypothetical protein K0U47_12545 [Epsilonproteobacteria bacterium]|nr:hypothetical protein [Campylobacterota bacterium]